MRATSFWRGAARDKFPSLPASASVEKMARIFGCPSAFTRCVTASVPAALLLAPQLPMPVAAVPVKADAGPEFLKLLEMMCAAKPRNATVPETDPDFVDFADEPHDVESKTPVPTNKEKKPRDPAPGIWVVIPNRPQIESPPVSIAFEAPIAPAEVAEEAREVEPGVNITNSEIPSAAAASQARVERPTPVAPAEKTAGEFAAHTDLPILPNEAINFNGVAAEPQPTKVPDPNVALRP